MMQEFDVKFLEDPKHVFAPPQAYYWIANEGFSESHPRARNIIASIFVPREVIISISADVNDGQSMQAAVEDWLKAHENRVQRWKAIESDD